MTVSAAHSSAFFREALREGAVWTVRDDGGFPAPQGHGGRRSQPFWSLESRAQHIIDTVPAYAGMETARISLVDFRARWLPGLQADGVGVGLNWSGRNATGYDLEATDIEEYLARADRA
ncbi:DUF2750 domain-containing protein [Aeromicrobium sp. IC_218]|uniref:DUF2750 domain-containing protein n=1 Tax=Aeromicrobium sp. IC_218 TaxID=2545468 RepID=UPI0013F3CF18|nr:DUF2750 domain-containing protein [Aeromicrobium sp. IC_218]